MPNLWSNNFNIDVKVQKIEWEVGILRVLPIDWNRKMVLSELSSQLTNAINAIVPRGNNTLDQAVIDKMIIEITRSLLAADVNVNEVRSLRDNIRSQINLSSLPPGMNKPNYIRKVRRSNNNNFYIHIEINVNINIDESGC